MICVFLLGRIIPSNPLIFVLFHFLSPLQITKLRNRARRNHSECAELHGTAIHDAREKEDAGERETNGRERAGRGVGDAGERVDATVGSRAGREEREREKEGRREGESV